MAQYLMCLSATGNYRRNLSRHKKHIKNNILGHLFAVTIIFEMRRFNLIDKLN
jgi:hypothetical protein